MGLPELSFGIRKRDPDNGMGSDAEIWNSVWAPRATPVRHQGHTDKSIIDGQTGEYETSLDDVFNDAPVRPYAGRRSQHDQD
jgi:hypothetical protein